MAVADASGPQRNQGIVIPGRGGYGEDSVPTSRPDFEVGFTKISYQDGYVKGNYPSAAFICALVFGILLAIALIVIAYVASNFS